MNIAFASSNGEKVDQHFGWSKSFYLYNVEDNKTEFLAILDSSEEPDGEMEKLDYKISTIKEADIMYCTQIGPTASKMIQSKGIHPVKVAEGEKIEDALSKLQFMLSSEPPMWLLRIYHKSKSRGE